MRRRAAGRNLRAGRIENRVGARKLGLPLPRVPATHWCCHR